MRRTFLSIPAIVLACATSSQNPQKSATRQAQEDAQQQYQKAATAQKHAGEEQQKAEQAERDVTKAQKALADAQARLAGQRAKMVASILVNRYQVDSKRIFMTSAASGEGSKVDLAFARTQ